MWWIIAALIFLGILFLLGEILLVPGVGVAGILGLLSLAASSWYAFAELGTGPGIAVTVFNIALVVATVVVVLRSKTWKKLELGEEIKATVEDDSAKVAVGAQGVTVTRLAPMGTARIGSLSCEVKSADNNMIAPKTPVEVVGIVDSKILVKPVNND